MPSLVPYLNFAGRSRKATAFYASVFGGRADVQEHDGVVVQFEFTADGIRFMGSDHVDEGAGIGTSQGYSMVLDCDSEDQLRSFYTRLVDGGVPVCEPVDGGWGAIIAHCCDRFGVSWLLNHDT